MPIDKQLEPISILHEKFEEQFSLTENHNFYEFIFILSGKGQHVNHEVRNEFFKGDFFLVKPGEKHSFRIDEPTEVFVARFTESARLVLKEIVDSSNGRAVALAKAKSPLNPKITFNKDDETLVIHIFQLLETLCKEPSMNESLCYYQLVCLIAIIERNLEYPKGKLSRPIVKKDIARILNYINKNLHDPEMLTLNQIAHAFNMSKNLLGNYFSKEMGQPVKQYINQCRMKVIVDKIAKSDLSFSEIAYQFGFTDESHFNKSFKKTYGMTPSSYRRK